MSDNKSTPNPGDRVGVYFCECHSSGLCDRFDFDDLETFAHEFPQVVLIRRNPKLCGKEAIEGIKKDIKEHSLKRILVATCAPDKHLEEFRTAAVEAGLNRYLVDAVNIREQLAFIHTKDPEKARKKARDQFAMGMANLMAVKPADKVYAIVDETKCNGCEICYTVCDKDAITMIPDPYGRVSKISHPEPDKCWGCGVCVTSCPVNVMDMSVYSNAQMEAQVDTFIERMEPNMINSLVFACHWCAYPAGDAAGAEGIEIEPDFRIIRTLCSGRVNPDWVLKALSRGADGVLLMGGKPNHCHFNTGNIRTMRRMKLIKFLMEQMGLDGRRFRVEWVNPDEPYEYANIVNSFVNDLRKLGPNPLSSRESDYSSAKNKKEKISNQG
ncbi:MAG: hypothetical protein PWQ88_69 [Candidatus Methanomethylophilaceae archaeon]|nr:hypothetical protein [Candidatus Methanomethylophilaceae archaeon]